MRDKEEVRARNMERGNPCTFPSLHASLCCRHPQFFTQRHFLRRRSVHSVVCCVLWEHISFIRISLLGRGLFVRLRVRQQPFFEAAIKAHRAHMRFVDQRHEALSPIE